MRAVGLAEFGGPEVLEVFDLPEPVPGPGEVRIRVHAAAVNPTDTGFRSGATSARLEGRPKPYVPGMDAAGVIDVIGSEVDTTLHVGDRVMAVVLPYGPNGGAYADFVVVPVASVVRAPAGLDLAAASTVLMNALTARLALDDLAIPEGGTVMVTGAAGAFGGYAVQLAKSDGLFVLADASLADEALVAGLGADEVVRRGDDVAARPSGRASGRRWGDRWRTAPCSGAARHPRWRWPGGGPRLGRTKRAGHHDLSDLGQAGAHRYDTTCGPAGPDRSGDSRGAGG